MRTALHRLSRVAGGGGAVLAVLVAISLFPPTTVTADERVLTPEEMDVEFVRLWNENKLDELGDFYYAEDALLLPPNHEPIRGRKNIVEELKGLRQAFGEFQTGVRPLQVVEAGDLTSIVNQGAFLQGGVRAVMHEAFERQPDGGWKVIVDMPGFRDPQRQEGQAHPQSERIIYGDRWLTERTKCLREQLEAGDITDNQRTLIETELDMLSEERGVPTAGYRWPPAATGSDGSNNSGLLSLVRR